MDRSVTHAIEEKKTLGEQVREFLSANANLLLAAGIALLLLSDVFGTHGVLAMRRSQKQAADIQKQIDQLDQENKQLEDRVKSLKTDPSSVEHIAREEMGLARPGEYIFKVPSRQNGAADSRQTPSSSPARP
jgi:cell division protein FtsB